MSFLLRNNVYIIKCTNLCIGVIGVFRLCFSCRRSGILYFFPERLPDFTFQLSYTVRFITFSSVITIPMILFFLNLFIDFWLCWVFVSVRGLSLVAASRGHSSSRCAGLSLSWPLLLRGTGSRCAGSVVVAHGPSRSAACGIFPDRGTNPCPLRWQADS